jgi:hypothetical protein
MVEYKYNKDSNKFTENGHTMFEFDILRRLKRLAYLEEQIKLLRTKEVSTLTDCVWVVRVNKQKLRNNDRI